MQATPNDVTPAIGGIDQQDFDQIQLLVGVYPYQKGLQKRIPGKTLIEQVPFAIGSIYVFYNVYGRGYILADYNGNIQITPVVIPPITLTAQPPNDLSFFDDFSGYSPVGLVSRLWGGGIWNNTIGICETIIDGFYDPFQVGTGPYTYVIWVPQPVTSVPQTEPLLTPSDIPFTYPTPPLPDVLLNTVYAHGDNSCEGQGTSPVTAYDFINYYYYEGGAIVDTFQSFEVPVGHITHWNGIKIGRLPDVDIGLVQGACPGPPPPIPLGYHLYANTGEFGLGA